MILQDNLKTIKQKNIEQNIVAVNLGNVKFHVNLGISTLIFLKTF